MIDKIREIVKEELADDDWKFHTSLVVKNALYLANITGEDEELAEIAALLHDIGGYRRGWDNHEIKGSQEAEKILTNLGYDIQFIEKIKHSILAHRTGGFASPETKLAMILRDADVLSHFEAVPYLIHIGLSNNENNIEKATMWVRNKLKNDYENKLHFSESKKMVKTKYDATMLLLN